MLNPGNVIGKILSGNRMPSFGNNRMTIPKTGNYKLSPARDTFSQNMVRYNYFEVTLENGQKKLMYGGSIAAVKRMLQEDKVQYTAIKEISYADAQKYGTDTLDSTRKGTKGVYSNRGMKIVPDSYLGK
jgi:hypothetical protein